MVLLVLNGFDTGFQWVFNLSSVLTHLPSCLKAKTSFLRFQT